MARKRKKAETSAYMDANEFRPTVCPLPLHSFRKRKWTGKKPRSFILSWLRHRCNDQIHTVAIASGGQLIFKNHTIAELKRELILCKMGGSCKCAQLYWDWRVGNSLSGVIQNLGMERGCWYTTHQENSQPSGIAISSRTNNTTSLAYRLMLKRRKRRRCIDDYQGVSVPSPEYTGYRGKVKGYGGDMVELKGELVKKMQSWGWKVSNDGVSPPQDHDNPYAQRRFVTFDTTHTTPPRVTLTFDTGNSATMSLSVHNRGDFNPRLACDLSEVAIIRYQLSAAGTRNVKRRSNEIRSMVDRRKSLFTKYDIMIGVDDIDKKSVNYSVTVTATGLTLQGADLLAKELVAQFGKKYLSVVWAGKKRMKSSLRLPMPRSSGMYLDAIPVEVLQKKLQK